MDEKKLKLFRDQINALDEELLVLLNKRAEIALEIGEAKGDLPVYDPSREGEILKQIGVLNKGPLSKGSVEDIFASIITACRQIQIKQ